MESHMAETRVSARLAQLEAAGQHMGGQLFIQEFERISADVDDAMRAGINTVRRRNVGYARSPTLTRAATIVRYWKTQLRAARQNVALSKAAVKFAQQHSLPTEVQSSSAIFENLHKAYAHLRHIQQHAAEIRGQWMENLAEAAAAEKNTSKAVALKQIVEENRVRRLFRRLKPLKQDIRSGALANVKIPSRQWFYHEGSDSLFQYDQGAFFSHSRLETVDGDSGPFRSQRT